MCSPTPTASRRFWPLGSTSALAFSFAAVVSACVGPSGAPGAPGATGRDGRPSAAPAQSGGSDGSGGITGISTPDQVRASIEAAKLRVAAGFVRMSRALTPTSEGTPDRRWTDARRQHLAQMLSGNAIEPESVTELLSKNLIRWTLRDDGPCHTTDHRHADGAGRAPRSVCLSVHRLTRFRSDLDAAVVQLIAHELAHLYYPENGDDRPATAIGSLFAESADIWNPDLDRVRAIVEVLEQQARWWPDVRDANASPENPNLGADLSPFCGDIVLPFNTGLRHLLVNELVVKSRERVYFSQELSAHAVAIHTYMRGLSEAQSRIGWTSENCRRQFDEFFLRERLPEVVSRLERSAVLLREFFDLGPRR